MPFPQNRQPLFGGLTPTVIQTALGFCQPAPEVDQPALEVVHRSLKVGPRAPKVGTRHPKLGTRRPKGGTRLTNGGTSHRQVGPTTGACIAHGSPSPISRSCVLFETLPVRCGILPCPLMGCVWRTPRVSLSLPSDVGAAGSRTSQGNRRTYVQSLCKAAPKIFSNHWKTGKKIFQSLEKSGHFFQSLEKKFPIIGKFFLGAAA